MMHFMKENPIEYGGGQGIFVWRDITTKIKKQPV